MTGLIMFMPGYVTLGLVSSGYDRLRQVNTGFIMLGEVIYD
jgi:hypothetical protein